MTVTLKDKMNIALTGLSNWLTLVGGVKVPGSTMHGSWTDKGNGKYVATYTAITVMTNQKASLKPDNWPRPVESAQTYNITTAPLDPDRSSLDRTPDTILANATDKSTLELTLRDTLGHPVKGQVVEFMTDKGTVGATTDNQDGTYMAALTARPDVGGGTANITVKVGGKRFGMLKTTVTVGSIDPDARRSAILLDHPSYVVGNDMHVTVYLKNEINMPLIGDAGHLTSTSITSPGAEQKTPWVDKGDGSYTATFTAKNVIRSTISLKLASGTTNSDLYDITGSTSYGASTSGKKVILWDQQEQTKK